MSAYDPKRTLVAIELLSAEGHLDRLPALVDLPAPVAVIVGNLNAALATKPAATPIPIIFATRERWREPKQN